MVILTVRCDAIARSATSVLLLWNIACIRANRYLVVQSILCIGWMTRLEPKFRKSFRSSDYGGAVLLAFRYTSQTCFPVGTVRMPAKNDINVCHTLHEYWKLAEMFSCRK